VANYIAGFFYCERLRSILAICHSVVTLTIFLPLLQIVVGSRHQQMRSDRHSIAWRKANSCNNPL